MLPELDVAARQHGVITTAQLGAVGVGRNAIAHRVRQGRLRRLHRGVYVAGPLEAPLTRVTAAVLACGDGAVVSHRTAAALWRLLDHDGPIEVSVPRATRSRDGVRLHRSSALDAAATTRLEGLPITSPARTLLDLAACVVARDLARALDEAQLLRLVTRAELLRTAAAARPGAARLRALLAAHAEPRLTRSEAERRLLELVRAAGLPEPETNVRMLGLEVDALWRPARLVLEVDGWAAHGTQAAFERDRRRDAALQLAGYRVVRVTWRRLTGEPLAVVALLTAALTTPGPAAAAGAA